MISCFKVEKDEGNHPFFIKNGGVLLEELVRFYNGRSNPIRHFSSSELLIATKYYDERQMFLNGSDYKLYKGFLKDLPIIVKKYDNEHQWVSPYKDIAIGSQMSVHKNVLKVIGCCLETEKPTVVYEFSGTKSLSTCICATNDRSLPWKSRLKIAVDLANAITYLHTEFSRPVIHRDIRCSNILLDENNVPKLTHFGRCISIPEGQSHVTEDPTSFQWTEDFVAPETYRTGRIQRAHVHLTEKADVYQFGMLLIQLLSGQKPGCLSVEHIIMESLSDVVDKRITEEGIEVKQLQEFATLLLRCISSEIGQRPTMIEVAKQLRRIHQAFTSPC